MVFIYMTKIKKNDTIQNYMQSNYSQKYLGNQAKIDGPLYLPWHFKNNVFYNTAN